jgi:hypothetical protein
MGFQNVDKNRLMRVKTGSDLFKSIISMGDIWRMDEKVVSSWNMVKWPISPRKQIELKSRKEVVEKIINEFKNIGKYKIGEYVTIDIGGQPVKFQGTGQVTDSAGRKISEATMTRIQELGSAWIFKRSIQDNVSWNSWEDIRKDEKTMNELFNIWKTIGKADDVGDDWLQNFYKQNEALIKKISKPAFTEFNRESEYTLPGSSTSQETFMDWVTKLVKEYCGVSKKDNWNPADIWLIQDEDKHRKKIMDVLSGNKKNGNAQEQKRNLLEINAIFRTLFKSKQVFGISLKKISASDKKAKIIYQNHNETFFKNLDSLTFATGEIKSNFSTKIEKGLLSFGTQDSRIFVKNGNEEYSFQIKANDSTKRSGLKYEPSPVKGAARLGKATVEFVLRLLEDHDLKFDKSPDSYPVDLEEFMKKKAHYKRLITRLKGRGVDLGESNINTIIDNIMAVFATKPHVANSKLQQLTFLDLFTSLPKDEMDELVTDMVFLAMKVGRNYGPFAKIY